MAKRCRTYKENNVAVNSIFIFNSLWSIQQYLIWYLVPWLQKAKKKPLTAKKPGDFGVEIKPTQEVISVEDPPVREAGQIVESVDELVGKLKESGLA